uniref:Conserved plasma membrane protein n=1 Tax=Haemonchus contortus TaxID=6289 RepID=A0A7I4Y8A6_HAECO
DIKIRDDSIYGVVLDAPPRRGKPLEHISGPIPVKSHVNDGCFNRIPYASLMAALLCFIGVILFSVMMAWGFNATAEQTRRTLKIQDWPWVDKVQVFFVVIAVLMSLFSLFFLLVGFSATGATREEMYKRKEAKCGGRFACVVAMLFCAALLICWLFIISIVSIFCGSYFIFDDLCLDMSTFTEENCINFEVFAPLVRSFSSADLRLCGGDAQQFCAFSATARSWYIVGWVGSCFVIIGLSSFLAVLAANYAHVGNVGRYVELRDLALDVSSNGSPTHSKEDSFYYPSSENNHRNIPLDTSFSGQTSWQRQYDGSTSTSRLAEKMSNSVSQYAYRPRKRPF